MWRQFEQMRLANVKQKRPVLQIGEIKGLRRLDRRNYASAGAWFWWKLEPGPPVPLRMMVQIS